jgi:hypothetical protein
MNETSSCVTDAVLSFAQTILHQILRPSRPALPDVAELVGAPLLDLSTATAFNAMPLSRRCSADPWVGLARARPGLTKIAGPETESITFQLRGELEVLLLIKGSAHILIRLGNTKMKEERNGVCEG